MAVVPREALRLAVGSFLLAAGDGDAVTAHPFRGVAISGEVLDHWYWDRFVLDPSGVEPRSDSVLLDWCHDYDNQIGYLDSFVVQNSQLVVSGAIVPYPENPEDKATEVLTKTKRSGGKMRWQMSVDFGSTLDGDMDIEFCPTGATVQVAGKLHAGPLTVIRRWPLNAVALCPHGYDAKTTAQLSEGSSGVNLSLPAEFLATKQLSGGLAPAPLSSLKGHPMSETKLTPPDAPATPPAVNPPAVTPPAQLAAPATPPPAAPSTPPAAAQLTPETLRKWSELLGPEQAIASLSAGESLETALGHRIATLTKANADQLTAHSAALAAKDAEITALKAKLSAARPGIEAPTGSALDAGSSGDRASMLTPVDKTAAAIDAAMKAKA
jgi:hypothetical protein